MARWVNKQPTQCELLFPACSETAELVLKAVGTSLNHRKRTPHVAVLLVQWHSPKTEPEDILQPDH